MDNEKRICLTCYKQGKIILFDYYGKERRYGCQCIVCGCCNTFFSPDKMIADLKEGISFYTEAKSKMDSYITKDYKQPPVMC